jgi:hypothetical protein
LQIYRVLRFTGLLAALGAAIPAQVTVTGFSGVSASLQANGNWSVFVPAQSWTFSGSLGANAPGAHADSGTDDLGSYQEIAFAYSVSGNPRAGAIRLYPDRPVVMFFAIYNSYAGVAPNTAPFPAIRSYPALHHLSFNGMFSAPDFTELESDSPWIYFDDAYNTFVLSPAANLMTAQNTLTSNGTLTGGIAASITSLPAGFTHATALVFGQGINSTVAAWGRVMTDITGKKRPANDADALLKSVSYWTDNGATYYYNPGASSYMSTLDAVKNEFDTIGVRLGSLQLDSWWYPKGPDNSWSSHSGIWTYTAAPSLFQPDLATFQSGLKTPLITHARWIDSNSPYRGQYTISGNVATDAKYWEDVGAYLHSSGVTVYEQDWLGDNAQSDLNLTDPYLFLGNMATSMARRGINIQYCMADPKHFLQSTAYSNVTTIRTSQDRFGADRWTPYFYSSAFASAVGLWPFSDVFMSGETNNMIAALLSAGPLGVGDALGNLSRTNLRRAARPDGVIVKPDTAATPVDAVFVADANGAQTPMIASATTDFGGGLTAHYIFAYARGTNNAITIEPPVFGIQSASVLYDYFGASATYIPAGQTYTLNLVSSPGYYVLVPVGGSGLAFLGDEHQFVTLGRQRIASVKDSGVLDVTVSFAAGEKSRTIFGYSGTPVSAFSVAGGRHAPVWNQATGLFSIVVTPSSKGVAELQIATAAANSSSPEPCATNCLR